MSYLYNQRKKVIRRFKRNYGKGWYAKFLEFVEKLKETRTEAKE